MLINVVVALEIAIEAFEELSAGVDILALPPIIILEINKQFDKAWKGIKKIRHY